MKAIAVSKQDDRNDRKKRKLVALANLVQLNDIDRINQTQDERQEPLDGNDEHVNATKMDDDGFVKVTHKKNLINKSVTPSSTDDIEQPNKKRVKLFIVGQAKGQCSDASLTGSDESVNHLKLSLTHEQYKDLGRHLRERKRLLTSGPSLRLHDIGYRASLSVPQEQRTPIFLTDIQHLIMSALIGNTSPCTPHRWCFFDNPVNITHSVVLILEGLSLYHYVSNESLFEQTNKIFDTRLEMILPVIKDSAIINELVQVPLTNVQAKQLIERYGSLESAIEMIKDPTLLVKAIFPILDATPDPSISPEAQCLPEGDKIPRTKLLLSALQMVDEGYPMPLRGELRERFKHYVFTKAEYQSVTNQSPMFGVDCEMCRTNIGMNELTRVSIVNEKFETVYETLVMPHNKIIDYLTPFSGITPEIMKTVTKTLREVQSEIQALLPPDAILVGQSLNSDLNALRMMHPYVIDTSISYNLTGLRKRKSKLQTLAMTFLKQVIQGKLDGHDSVEDSLASLRLVKLKLANSFEFGDEILLQKKRVLEVLRVTSTADIKNNILAHASQRDKRTAIITAGTLEAQLKTILREAEDSVPQGDLKAVTLYELDSNKAAVKKARDIAMENSLTIANLQLTEEEFHLDVAEQTVNRLDKWIRKLWKTVAHDGMFVVLLGGSKDCPSGVAKIAIKKCVADVATQLPITI